MIRGRGGYFASRGTELETHFRRKEDKGEKQCQYLLNRIDVVEAWFVLTLEPAELLREFELPIIPKYRDLSLKLQRRRNRLGGMLKAKWDMGRAVMNKHRSGFGFSGSTLLKRYDVVYY